MILQKLLELLRPKVEAQGHSLSACKWMLFETQDIQLKYFKDVFEKSC